MNEFDVELERLRNKIDEVDLVIYESIYKRFLLTNEIGSLKSKHGIIEMSEKRREEIYEKMKSWAIRDGISVNLITEIYETIFDISILEQTILINKENT
jgi:chorismate mutase